MKKKGLGILAVMCLGILMLTGCGGSGKIPYEVVVDEVFITNTYDGESLAVNLNVENKSNEYVLSGMIGYQITATLDGESMTPGFIPMDSANYINTENNIASGESGKSQAVYALGGQTEGEVVLTGVTRDKDGKTVEFLKETINLAEVEKKFVKSEYALTVDKVSKTDDGKGNDIIIIDLTFDNNSKGTGSFGSTVELEIFQNGTGLKTGYLPYDHPAYDDEREGNAYVDIQGGKSIQVRMVYNLNDANAPIELKAVEYSGYDVEPLLEKEIQVE